MKKFIYLFGIVTLLASCRSNSFTTQKYTHFSNAQKHKHVQHTDVALHKKVNAQPATDIQTNSVSPVVVLDLPNEDRALTALGKIAAVPVKRQWRALPGKIAEPVKTSIAYASHATFNIQKSKVDTSTRGVIDEVLGLVLTIILIVVLVAAIIVLVAIL